MDKPYKVGYFYCIEMLLEEYKRLIAEFRKAPNNEDLHTKLRSLAEGLEQLCEPYGIQDEVRRSPVADPNLNLFNKPENMSPEQENIFEGNSEQVSRIHLVNKMTALSAIGYMRENHV